jgi:hypothetical protein
MQPDSGIFTISLDFELFWGVRDHRTLESYGKNIETVHQVIPRLLELLTRYDVHATWATVGFLFFQNKEHLLNHVPRVLPDYQHKSYDPYPYLKDHQLEERYHFAPGLIKQIAATSGQEVATHTFSHFYTLEEGATNQSFEADILAAMEAGRKLGIDIKSIVFPRNQYSDEALRICKEAGIQNFRGTERSWIYQTRSRAEETMLRRFVRICDAYFNISGSNTYGTLQTANGMINIPSSQFLRPFSKKLRLLDPLRLTRIKNSMTLAARKGQVYHLWWHPHNFGSNTEENFAFLTAVLDHFRQLQKNYKMQSQNMEEIGIKLSL